MMFLNQNKFIKTFNRILFLLFSVAFTCFFQADLVRLALLRLTDYVVTGVLLFAFCLVLALFVTFMAIPVKKLLKFSKELDAMNYLPSALLLGALTSMNESYWFGYSWRVWLLLLGFLVVFIAFSKLIDRKLNHIVENKQRDIYNLISTNLFVMTLVISLTAFVGNTDEFLQRELRSARYISSGEYGKALLVGLNADETSSGLAILRSYAMAQLEPASGNMEGSELGNRLFLYPQKLGVKGLYGQNIHGYSPSKGFDTLISQLAALQLPTGLGKTLNYQLAALLLERNVSDLASIILMAEQENNLSDSWFPDSMPQYYMQAMVLEESLRGTQFNLLDSIYPGQTARTRVQFKQYTSHSSSLLNKPEQYRKNNLGLRYRHTYWWYFNFL